MQKRDRRNFFYVLGSTALALPYIYMQACNSEKAGQNPKGRTSPAGNKGGTSDQTPADDTTNPSTNLPSGDASTQTPTTQTPTTQTPAGDSSTPWASGGTTVMKGNYPDPFTDGLGTTCAVYKAATLGPCYAKTQERQDISEGEMGLPTRMTFLVVDSKCKPVSGASVDIWHCSSVGLYSGNDANSMCTGNNSGAKAKRYFRGVQTTNAQGRVDFDTCFPGWYSGRTIHVHFTIRVNGTEYITSQLFFEDTLNNEIIASQPLYKDRGVKDTTNTNDNVLKQSSLMNYYFQTQKMADGAMLAWKTLVIKS